MAPRRTRFGLTLVELLVVIVIVTLLVGLLLPGLGGSHTSARRATCFNSQKNLALALLNYEAVYQQFPGYVNRIATDKENQILGSWVVPLFPYLERQDLWKEWSEGKPEHVFMRLLVCPSDPPEQSTKSDTPLSYVANCGRPGDEDTVAHGIFHNHDVDSDPVTVCLDDLDQHDGATYTLLLSENVQAGRWTDTTEANVGIVWREKPDKCSPINQCLDAGDRPQDLQYARPSSHHGAGAIVSFCDGHQEFLRDGIDYQVYQHLMTPDSKAAGVPGEFDPSQL